MREEREVSVRECEEKGRGKRGGKCRWVRGDEGRNIIFYLLIIIIIIFFLVYKSRIIG